MKDSGTLFMRPHRPIDADGKQHIIQYEILISEADLAKNLHEVVGKVHVWPRPKPIRKSSFKIREKVDAFYNDGWWVVEISKLLG